MSRTVPGAVRLAPEVEAIRPYRVPRHPAPIDLALDGNEGAFAPDAVLRPAAPAGDLARRYPSPARLEAALAARLGIDADRVAVTAGGDDALCRALRLVAAPGREIVLPAPTFEMIPAYARLHGMRVREIPWDGAWPREAVLAALGPETAAVAVVTPNNPTGATASVADLAAVARAAGGALVVLDQAYAEYDDDAPTRAALAFDNVVTVRSLSKAWGLAGLRVGYAVGPAALVERLRAVGQPYAVSGPSLAVALRAVESGDAWMRDHVARVRGEREALAALLAGLDAAPRPSRANFVLADFADPAWVADALAGLGIAVRRFPEKPGLERALRITCPGTAEGFDRLGRGLRAALAPEAVLFDMDGVLADASRSYREAIVRTAASFGVAVSAADVRRVKAAGDANNDWVVTRRLLAAAGVEAPIDEVVRRFEALYQGVPGTPGLKETERLIPDAAALDRVRERAPIAVVTGRPRRDADEFLERFAIADRFDAVVAMEDGPPKPDPAPVALALERLGVASAWMVGDTPDDVRAARAAGVVPLAVVAPGDDPSTAEDLLAAGAARVISGIEDVEALLAAALDRKDRP